MAQFREFDPIAKQERRSLRFLICKKKKKKECIEKKPTLFIRVYAYHFLSA